MSEWVSDVCLSYRGRGGKGVSGEMGVYRMGEREFSLVQSCDFSIYSEMRNRLGRIGKWERMRWQID